MQVVGKAPIPSAITPPIHRARRTEFCPPRFCFGNAFLELWALRVLQSPPHVMHEGSRGASKFLQSRMFSSQRRQW